jgi:hypothetical protein
MLFHPITPHASIFSSNNLQYICPQYPHLKKPVTSGEFWLEFNFKVSKSQLNPLRNQVFLEGMLCCWEVVQDRLTLEDYGSTILWNVQNHLLSDPVSQPRILLIKHCYQNLASCIRSFVQMSWEDWQTATNHIRQIAVLVMHLKTNTRNIKWVVSIYPYCSHEHVPDLQAIIGHVRHKLRLQSVVQDVHNFLHFIQYVGISYTRRTVIELSTKDTVHFRQNPFQ